MGDPSWATGLTAVANGGWQGDTFTMLNCNVSFNGIAAFSTESGQNLNQTFINCNTGGAGGLASMALSGGRINLYGVSFTSTAITVADIWSNVGANQIVMSDIHSESGATNLITTINSGIPQYYSLNTVRGTDIYIQAGGAIFDISNSQLGDIHRVDANQSFQLDMRNSSVSNLVLNATISTNVFLNLSAINYRGTGDFIIGDDPTNWHGTILNLDPISALDSKRFVLSGNDLTLTTAGKGLLIKEGSNARMGTATLVAGTVAVVNTSVTANTVIFLTRAATGGAVGHLSTVIDPGVDFDINSSSGTDTSTINWLLIEPSP